MLRATLSTKTSLTVVTDNSLEENERCCVRIEQMSYLTITLTRFSSSCCVGNNFIALVLNMRLIGSDKRDNDIDR